jgi:hypothetical protein
VVGEAVHLLDQAVGIELLDGRGDLGVQSPPAVVEQAPVRDLVGKCVLERVLKVRKEAGLVEQLRGLELG